MTRIFSSAARAGATRVLDPLARGLLRLRIAPDVVTVLGTLGVVVGAVGFVARGSFVIAVAVVGGSALVDLVDGAMARARGRPSRFGAVLDSSMDRAADGAIFGAVAYWYATVGELPTVAAALVCLVAGHLVSYVKARAQGVGIDCDVGLVERAERLLLVGAGALATGLGVGWALPAALWLLAILSLVTVVQRLAHVRAGAREEDA